MGAPRRPGHRGESRRGVVLRDGRGESFGDRLEWLRHYHKTSRGEYLTQHEMAKRISHALADGTEYGQASVGSWLNNLWDPPTRVMHAAAKAFRCDPGWLAMGNDTEARRPDRIEADDHRADAAARVADVVHRTLEERLADPRPPMPQDHGTREPRVPPIKRRPKRA